jgi:2-dehydropantoate 2-reductase
MHIGVMGAGAVGCYYGGMLARAGHTVSLIGRPQHVDAMRRHGLLLDTTSFRVHVPVQASTDADALGEAALVLVCVKSTDTEAAAQQMRPRLSPAATVLSLQNGVDNAERLQSLLQREVGPAVVYVAAEMAGPGHVRHHGRGELVIGPSAQADALAGLFTAAGVPVRVSANVVGELWEKLVLNCAFNAISAISQQPYGRLWTAPGVQAVMRDVVQECLAVAAGCGVVVPGDAWQAVERIAATMAAQLSSTAQDLARGKRSEIDHLNGYVVRQGERLGIATPVNRSLHTLVKLLEASAGA